MENKTWIIIVLLVVVAVGLFFTYNKFHKPVNDICSNCGKNSCDLDCSARKSDTLNDEDLKTLVPSCNLSASEMVERRSFLQSSLAKKITRVEELETGYDLIFEGQPKNFLWSCWNSLTSKEAAVRHLVLPWSLNPTKKQLTYKCMVPSRSRKSLPRDL